MGNIRVMEEERGEAVNVGIREVGRRKEGWEEGEAKSNRKRLEKCKCRGRRGERLKE